MTNERLPAIMERIRARMPDFAKQLPVNIKPENFVAAIQHALVNVPDLAACDMRSILVACQKAAADGLVPDGRDAVLVVGNSKEGNAWVKKAQYWVMVGGLQKLVYRTGMVLRLESRIVRMGDAFGLTYGSTPGISHQPKIPGGGDVIGAYCIATLKGNGQYVEWMDREEIDSIMRRSKSFSRDKNEARGPWATDFAEMARKTVTRRAVKYLPIEASLAHRDEDVDDGGAATSVEDEFEAVQVNVAAVPGGTITSGKPITNMKPVDEPEPQAVAEGELLAPPAPAPAPDEASRRETNGWKKHLRDLRDVIKELNTKETIEEAWMEWDAGFDAVPPEVTAKAKELIEVRLREIVNVTA